MHVYVCVNAHACACHFFCKLGGVKSKLHKQRFLSCSSLLTSKSESSGGVEYSEPSHSALLLEPTDGNKKIIPYLKHLHRETTQSCWWFPLFSWQCPGFSALSLFYLLPFALPAKKSSFFLQIVLASLLRLSLLPPSAPNLPPLLCRALSVYQCPPPFFFFYFGLMSLVLSCWNQNNFHQALWMQAEVLRAKGACFVAPWSVLLTEPSPTVRGLNYLVLL